MATARKKKSDVDADERQDDRELEREKQQDIDPFDRARLSFGKGSGEVIRVKFALCSPDGTEKHLETLEYDPDVHTEEFIRTRYGPGRYRLRFVGGADWRYRMTFTVDLAPLPASSSGASASSPAALGPTSFDLLDYFKRDSERARAEFNQLVLAVIAKGSPVAGGDSGIGKVLEVLGSQNAKLLELMLTRAQSPGPGAGAVDVVLKALELGMQTVSDAKADQEGGWVSALRGLARDLAPVLSQIVSQRGILPAAMAPALEAPPAAAPANVVPFPIPVSSSPVPPAAAVPDSAFRALLVQYAPAVLQAAREGQAPIDFAGSILDSVGVVYHPLFDSLTSNDVISLQPELGQIRWLNPETRADEGLWVDLVVQLLKSRDFGEEEGA